MKISLKSPGWHPSVIETEQHTIIQEAYVGPIFVSKEGVCLSVQMRDNGYDICCWEEKEGHIPGPYEVLPKSAIMFSVDLATGLKLLGDNPEGGVWFVFSYDTNAYPIAIYDNELDASRRLINQGYGHLVFWPFGKDWDELR